MKTDNTYYKIGDKLYCKKSLINNNYIFFIENKTYEIKRVHKDYGPCSILVQGDGHGECKTIHTPHGHQGRLLDMMGGFTQQVRNPDSWEGWYWGSKQVWGQGFQGMMSPAANTPGLDVCIVPGSAASAPHLEDFSPSSPVRSGFSLMAMMSVSSGT